MCLLLYVLPTSLRSSISSSFFFRPTIQLFCLFCFQVTGWRLTQCTMQRRHILSYIAADTRLCSIFGLSGPPSSLQCCCVTLRETDTLSPEINFLSAPGLHDQAILSFCIFKASSPGQHDQAIFRNRIVALIIEVYFRYADFGFSF